MRDSKTKQHALPALPDMEDYQVLLTERRRKAAAIRAAAEGDINRAGMILDNNLPSCPVDAVVFSQRLLEALQLQPLSDLAPWLGCRGWSLRK